MSAKFWGKWDIITLAIAVALILAGLLLGGCAHRGSLPGGADTSGLHGIPKLLAGIASVVAGVASVALILCGVAAFFAPNKLTVAKFAMAALAALVSAGLLWYLAVYWVVAMVLAGVCLVAGAVGWAWLHRKEIERRTGVDLDRDGRVGT